METGDAGQHGEGAIISCMSGAKTAGIFIVGLALFAKDE